jgi:hypothetical protein
MDLFSPNLLGQTSDELDFLPVEGALGPQQKAQGS